MSKPSNRLDPKSDPTRRCRKLTDWPKTDQDAWGDATTQPCGLMDEAGLASHWRPSTCRSVQNGYGRWLTFLDRRGWLDLDISPAERLTPDRLRAFISELRATVAPLTVRNRIRDLAEALRVMAPGADLPYLRLARQRLKSRSRPSRSKRKQMRPSQDLLWLGLALTKKAEHGEAARPLWRAALYRDGLMIMMLACRPLRRGNFAGLRLGQHLVRREDVYVILLDETETKNRRSFEQPLPAALTPFIERYLEHYRPQQLAGSSSDHVWINWRGEPLAESGVYTAVMTRTKAAFGTAIPPHRFRDCAVTSLGETDPEFVWLAPTLLHHADRRIAERHYNQARDGRAVALWQNFVRAERQEAHQTLRSGNARAGRRSARGGTGRSGYLRGED